MVRAVDGRPVGYEPLSDVLVAPDMLGVAVRDEGYVACVGVWPRPDDERARAALERDFA
jgi:hypothetical protein